MWQEEAGLRKINATDKKRNNINTPTLSPSQSPNATDTIPRKKKADADNELNGESNNNENIHLQEINEAPEDILAQPIGENNIPNQDNLDHQMNAEINIHQDQEDTSPAPPTTRSGRQVRWSRRYREGLESSLAEMEDGEYYDALHREDYKI